MDRVNEELTAAQWRRSSFTGDDGGNCVEVAILTGRRRAVRDSKDPAKTTVVFSSGAWTAFLDHLK
ncbi:hypothetical protein GCM10009677_23080 [Sphaerisporangium rubeum]|uniref:DUF397 domain-containing protein n=1 Tax=Sphaerisporangium rubeum TaxID=321317 RepID=UPI001619A816|nr:DUF397 domain-containing protein [Sphaerisporangium rubeum]